MTPPDLEQAALLAEKFHDAYERLAPTFGYTTRPESAKPWADVPEANKRLMSSVIADVFIPLLLSTRRQALEEAANIASNHECGGDDDIICQHQNCASIIAGELRQQAER